MADQRAESLSTLCFLAEHIRQFSFPNLKRPPALPNDPATEELVNWGVKVYCFSWICHLSALLNGISTLTGASNNPSAIIVARSAYELGAHAYYVKKHFKQHIDAKDLEAAWEFLTPIATGSRYMNEQFPETSDMFPAGVHISKAVKCLGETVPKEVVEGYSFISEYCHPNMFAFSQYFRWINPFEVGFVNHTAQGMFGSVAVACVTGLIAVQELMSFTGEKAIAISLKQTLLDLVKSEGTSGDGA